MSAVEASAWQMAMEVEWREEKGTEGAEVAIGARPRRVMSPLMSPPVVEAAIEAKVRLVPLALAKGSGGTGRSDAESGSRCR